jgi:ABC-type multidrug transport system permease subunit
VFYREHAAGTYGVFSYWSSEFVAEVPWLVLFSIIYSVILYFSIGFINDAGKASKSTGLTCVLSSSLDRLNSNLYASSLRACQLPS